MSETSTFSKIIKISKLIPLKSKNLLILLIISGATLELAGLSTIGPFLTLMMDPDKILEIEFLKLYFDKFPPLIKENYLISFGFFLVILFLIINTFLSFLYFYIDSVSRKFSSNLSAILIRKYLQNEFSFLIKKNINELSKNVLIETVQLVYGIFVPIMTALTKLLIILFVISFLMIINFKITILLIIFFMSIFLSIYFFVQNKLSSLGNERAKYDKQKFITINDSLESVKEAKLLNIENFFTNRFMLSADDHAKVVINMNKYIIFPKYFIEYVVFTTLILIIMIVSINGKFISYVPILSIYVFAGYRILPGLQVILNAISSIRKSEKSLNIIYNELYKNNSEQNKIQQEEVTFDKKISIKNLSFTFENSTTSLFQNLNFEIEKNSKVAIIGETGIGKSTFVDLITGLYLPLSGSIEIDKIKLTYLNRNSWQKLISYVPQKIFLYESTIKSNVALGQDEKKIDNEKVRKSLNFAELDEFDLNYNLLHNANNLSGGEKQRLGIARAIYSERPIIIMDECTNALDKNTELKIIKKLIAQEKTIFMITHNTDYLKFFDKILYISKNKVIFDDFKSIYENKDFIISN